VNRKGKGKMRVKRRAHRGPDVRKGTPVGKIVIVLVKMRVDRLIELRYRA